MLRQITARQFREWRAYADLEPFDEDRADARAAQVVQALLITEKAGKRARQKAPEIVELQLKYVTTGAASKDNTAEAARQRAAASRRVMDGMIADQKKTKRAGSVRQGGR